MQTEGSDQKVPTSGCWLQLHLGKKLLPSVDICSWQSCGNGKTPESGKLLMIIMMKDVSYICFNIKHIHVSYSYLNQLVSPLARSLTFSSSKESRIQNFLTWLSAANSSQCSLFINTGTSNHRFQSHTAFTWQKNMCNHLSWLQLIMGVFNTKWKKMK